MAADTTAVPLRDHAPGAHDPDHHPDLDEFAVVWAPMARVTHKAFISPSLAIRENSVTTRQHYSAEGTVFDQMAESFGGLVQLVRSFEHGPHAPRGQQRQNGGPGDRFDRLRL